MSKGAAWIGTSGWNYKHWKEVFYPADVTQRRWFEHYSSVFNTVEINASFYRIPTLKTVESWKSRSSSTFRFSIKMSRLITHIRKLAHCEKELQWFFSVFKPLYPKIGIYLIQLPPSLRFNPDRLNSFLTLLPSQFKFAFEFRNRSWYHDETYAMLRDNGHVFCVHDMGDLTSPKIITAKTVYIRLHGFDSTYGGDYPDRVLQQWASWINSCQRDGIEVYCYFNNDIGGFAVKNSLRLREFVASDKAGTGRAAA